jgi:hypothetical protein
MMLPSQTNLTAGVLRRFRIALAIGSVLIVMRPSDARAQIHTPHDHIPHFAANPTIRSASAGAWSSPATWIPARVPGPGDIVSIAHAVTFDSMAGDVDVIGIETGASLRFATAQPTRLKVATLMVLPGGRLEIGTPANPVHPSVTAEILIRNKPLDLGIDPDQYGTGLLSIDGIVTMHGAPKAPTFVRTAVEPRAGHTTLAVAQPVFGWNVGDRILVPDTRQVPTQHWFDPSYPLHMEERTILAISGNSQTLTLSSPLAFDHRGARDADGTPTVLPNGIRLLPHIANLTRNVVIRSENPSGTRGHTLYTSRSDVRIHYVQFQDLGRTRAVALDQTTNHIGRYPVHIHHVRGPANPTNTGYQFVLLGNAVNDSLKWPIAVHGSHFGLVRQNVVFGGSQLTGAGIAIEDGTETENLFEENFVASIRGHVNPRLSEPGTADGTTAGSAGECFWAAGFNNRLVNNVATGCRNTVQQIVSGPGFKFIVQAGPYTARNPLVRGADMADPAQTVAVTPQNQPLLEFRGNEVYGLAADGMTVWHVGTNGYDVNWGMSETLIQDFRVWHTYEAAIWNYPANRMVIEGLVYRIDPSAGIIWWPSAVTSGDYRDAQLTVRGGSIHAGSITAGMIDPLGTVRFENIDAVTHDPAFQFETPATPGSGADRPPSGVTIILRGNTIRPWPGRPMVTIQMKHDLSRANNQPNDKYEVFVYDYQGQPGNDFRVYFGVQASQPLYGGFAPCTDTTTHPEILGIVCSITGTPPPAPPPPTNPNLVTNGDFSNGLTDWQLFSTPTPSDIVSAVAGGILHFYRAEPSAGAVNQAVVFQSRSVAFGSDEPMLAQFDLGNSSSVRKRISIVLHNGQFNDLSVCTFWLAPHAPLRTYRMQMHTTQSWPGATIGFYAASTGSHGGYYLVDNVSLHAAPTQSAARTDCVDPTAPAPPGGAASANLVFDGGFSGPVPGSWVVFGQMVWQVMSGTFAFHRPTAATPAGAVLQATGQPMAAGQILTANFRLGNSSSVRKRVTAVLHDLDFTDLSVCTFWLAPGQAPSPYTMRTFTTEAWTDATVSFYVATVGVESWIMLDDVTLQRTPSTATVGTECHEPGSIVMFNSPASINGIASHAGGAPPVARGPRRQAPGPADTRVQAETLPGRVLAMEPMAGEIAALSLDEIIDLTQATTARLSFQSRLRGSSSAQVQVSTDGITWATIAVVQPSDATESVMVNLDAFAGLLVQVRFVMAPDQAPEAVESWQIADVLISR